MNLRYGLAALVHVALAQPDSAKCAGRGVQQGGKHGAVRNQTLSQTDDGITLMPERLAKPGFKYGITPPQRVLEVITRRQRQELGELAALVGCGELTGQLGCMQFQQKDAIELSLCAVAQCPSG